MYEYEGSKKFVRRLLVSSVLIYKSGNNFINGMLKYNIQSTLTLVLSAKKYYLCNLQAKITIYTEFIDLRYGIKINVLILRSKTLPSAGNTYWDSDNWNWIKIYLLSLQSYKTSYYYYLFFLKSI